MSTSTNPTTNTLDIGDQDEEAWTAPQNVEELVLRYPGLVEQMVATALRRLQHSRLHASDQDLDISQQMYIILDKPSGKHQISLLMQFDPARCPVTREHGWKTWLLNHVITKRVINILKEEARKGKFNQPIHEDAEMDEPSATIPMDLEPSPLATSLNNEEIELSGTRLSEFCIMIKHMDELASAEKETLIGVAVLHSEGESKQTVEDFLGGLCYEKSIEILTMLWAYFDQAYSA